ncbi:MAG: PP2C family protein-serine/threonine phosphatase [Acidimicrobiales bacterium]
MVGADLGAALRAAQSAPESVPDIMRRAARSFGATDVVVQLVDFGRSTLEPIPDRGMHAEAPQSESIATSMAGRAFIDGPVVADRTAGPRVWVPIIEGSDRTGVLGLTVPEATDAVVAACEELGLLAGHLIATHARTTDLYNLHRRRRTLSLAASMQWDLLPPIVLRAASATVAGLLEPAYDVGGDCFDYALNDDVLNVAIFDALGHGVESALIAALAIGSYRHDRRESRSLDIIHTNLDEAIVDHFPGLAFATGQLAQIDVATGTMTWTNAGHPPPMLIRRGHVIGELTCRPTVAWGLGSTFVTGGPVTVASESLEPGDSVLFYTDGVTEAHVLGGDHFGTDRLADLAGRHASDELEPAEVLRHIVQAVLDHRSDQLDDDATLVLVRWNGPDESRASAG